jgi:hypothetical protein
VYYPRGAFCCAFFGGQKDSMERIFIKKCFLFTVGTVCRVRRFSVDDKRFADDEEFETKVRKWLRQQSNALSMLMEDMSRGICFFPS